MNIKLFADGADKDTMIKLSKNPSIAGLTTNPTLMKKAGIKNYKDFSLDILSEIKNLPLSLEVFSDDLYEMEKQSLEISSWGNNVYVKIPITNTKGESTYNIIKNLSNKGVKINVTAIMTIEQVEHIIPAMIKCKSGYISIFAGRIADTGIDPLPIMKESVELVKDYPNLKILWASSRELYNIIQADNIGCHIITITQDIFNKIPMIGKDLNDLSLDTVKMFYDDAIESGFKI
jgi:transaldolase